MNLESTTSKSSDPGNKLFAIIGLSLVAAALIASVIWLIASQMSTHYLPAPASLQDKVICPQSGEIKDDRYYQSSLAPVTGLPGSVPDGFIPVYAVDCGFGPEYSDSHAPIYLSGNFTLLLKQLAEKSDRDFSGACPANLVLAPNLWLVNQQRQAIQVTWPTDACNHPKTGNSDPLENLVSSATPPAGFSAAVQP